MGLKLRLIFFSDANSGVIVTSCAPRNVMARLGSTKWQTKHTLPSALSKVGACPLPLFRHPSCIGQYNHSSRMVLCGTSNSVVHY